MVGVPYQFLCLVNILAQEFYYIPRDFVFYPQMVGQTFVNLLHGRSQAIDLRLCGHEHRRIGCSIPAVGEGDNHAGQELFIVIILITIAYCGSQTNYSPRRSSLKNFLTQLA